MVMKAIERGMHCQEGTNWEGGQEHDTGIGHGGGTRCEEDVSRDF